MTSPVATQVSVRTRTHSSSPGSWTASTTASPRRARISASTSARGSSATASAVSFGPVGPSVLVPTSVEGDASSVDDNGIPLPPLGHVLVLDALLQQHDALEQCLGTG